MLNKILPIAEIIKLFDSEIKIDEYGYESIDKITINSPMTLLQTSMSAWDRLIQLEIYDGDPQILAVHIQNGEPRIDKKISDIIGEPLIKDIYYVTGELDEKNLEDNNVFVFSVAHVYPKFLYLIDILLQNPLEPLVENEQRLHQTHKGFGMLGTVISNLEKVGKELGCDIISLTAADREQIPLFEKYGFSVRDSGAGKMSLAIGSGIPMDKNI